MKKVHSLTVRPHRARRGISQLDVLFLLGVCSFVFLLLTPALMRLRENSRRHTCQSRLHALTLGLQRYLDSQRSYPPAAIWDVNATASLALHRSRRIDRITKMNWVCLLLPYIGEESLDQQAVPEQAIGGPLNAALRTSRLGGMICPSDSWNRVGNPYRYVSSGGESLEFARGNYAINGGTHHFEAEPPTTSSPQGDFLHLEISESPRRYAMWGNGIAGINKSFRTEEFENGQSTFVALEEIRAGVHPLDPRGVWSLGQIGGSMTWGHGVNGDAYGPNNPWVRSDDILGCGALHEAVGTATLTRENMPCVDYVDANQQATSRSCHPGGVQVSFLDGSVRYISDDIDPSLWHVLHSRETPARILQDEDRTLVSTAFDSSAKQLNQTPQPLENSLGMSFVVIPAGTFRMGIPDRLNSAAPPEECPEHSVKLTHPFLLGKQEVTRNQFRSVMGAAALPEVPAIARPETLTEEQIEQLPVTDITWEQARKFCDTLARLPTEKKAGRRYRLPSEAEWEAACRAGSSEPYHWIKTRPQEDDSGEAAGILPPLPLTPVGTYPPNAWGLHDMRGNAWEWTNDWFARDYYARSPLENPTGPESGHLKVVRGSDWRFVGEVCRLDFSALPHWKSNPGVGFRVVCESSEQLAPSPTGE